MKPKKRHGNFKGGRVAETSLGVTHKTKKRLLSLSPYPRATFDEIINHLIKRARVENGNA